MEEVCDNAQEAAASGKDKELILLAQFAEYLLLVFLRGVSDTLRTVSNLAGLPMAMKA